MKKIYSLSFLLAAGVFVIPQNAHSFFTFDATAIMEAVSSNSNLVQQYSKIKEATKTASDISNSIGAAGKTFSELTIDKAKEAQDEVERLKKEAERIKELRSDIERREAELQGKKDLIASEVEKAKAYRESIGNVSSDVLGKLEEYGAGGNPYDIPEGEETYDETYNEEEILTPPSQNDQQEEFVEEEQQEEVIVEKPLPGRQEFGKTEESSKTEEELLKEELEKKEGSALENYGKPEAKDEEESEDNGSAVENYGDIEENEDGSAVENYGDPEKDYSKDGAVKNDKPSLPANGGKIQDAPSKPKVPFRGRKPFQKTSFYKNYELIASADLDKGKTVYDGTYKGRFVIPQKLAEKCKVNLDQAKETINMEECLITILKEMNNENASAAEDARKEYVNIIRDLTVGTAAVSMKIAVESAEFEDTVTKPLAEDVTSAGNTRDDIGASALVKLKGGTEIVNKLTETTAHRLKLDAMRQLGYHKVEDTKAVVKKEDGKDSETEKK